MKLLKTEKAREELEGSVRHVGRRERNMLIMAEGKTIQDLESIFKDETRSLAESLVRNGYLTLIGGPPPKPVPLPKPVPPPMPVLQPTNADAFEGKRSLATTRMFLFDMSERIFARRAPEQAKIFREAFRSARDRDSMLAAAREMMEAVEKVAGAERADSIGQSIAMLLPVEA